jgi:hypothetical protein
VLTFTFYLVISHCLTFFLYWNLLHNRAYLLLPSRYLRKYRGYSRLRVRKAAICMHLSYALRLALCLVVGLALNFFFTVAMKVTDPVFGFLAIGYDASKPLLDMRALDVGACLIRALAMFCATWPLLTNTLSREELWRLHSTRSDLFGYLQTGGTPGIFWEKMPDVFKASLLSMKLVTRASDVCLQAFCVEVSRLESFQAGVVLAQFEPHTRKLLKSAYELRGKPFPEEPEPPMTESGETTYHQWLKTTIIDYLRTFGFRRTVRDIGELELQRAKKESLTGGRGSDDGEAGGSRKNENRSGGSLKRQEYRFNLEATAYVLGANRFRCVNTIRSTLTRWRRSGARAEMFDFGLLGGGALLSLSEGKFRASKGDLVLVRIQQGRGRKE